MLLFPFGREELSSGDLIAVHDLSESMDVAVVTERDMPSDIGVPCSYPHRLQAIQDIIKMRLLND